MRRLRGATLGCALASLVTACGSSQAAGLEFRVSASDGTPVPRFFATVAFGEGEVESVACPADGTADAALDGAEPRLGCTARGFRVLGLEQPTHVTLKSRGNAFASVLVDTAARDTVDLLVDPLDDARLTEDYATRLDDADCLEDLRELALPFDSELGAGASVKLYARHLRTEPAVKLREFKARSAAQGGVEV